MRFLLNISEDREMQMVLLTLEESVALAEGKHLGDDCVINDTSLLICEHTECSRTILDALNISHHQLLQKRHSIFTLQPDLKIALISIFGQKTTEYLSYYHEGHTTTSHQPRIKLFIDRKSGSEPYKLARCSRGCLLLRKGIARSPLVNIPSLNFELAQRCMMTNEEMNMIDPYCLHRVQGQSYAHLQCQATHV